MKLYVGLTTRRDVDAACLDSILRFMHAGILGTRLDVIRGEGFVGRVRNQYTQSFLDDKSFTHLLNIDSDILFDKWHVQRLMSHDTDIVGGIYYKKEVDRIAVMEGFDGPLPTGVMPDLMQVRFMGTGFLMIKRVVFEKMIELYGEDIWYIEEGTKRKLYNFWPVEVCKEERRLLSEDWWFCKRANELGFRVYADTKCTIQHMGSCAFPILTREETDELKKLSDKGTTVSA